MKYYELAHELNLIGIELSRSGGCVWATPHGTDFKIYVCKLFVQEISKVSVNSVVSLVEYFHKISGY